MVPGEQEEIEAAQRDPARFAPLYDRYFRPIFLFVLRRCGDRDRAGDLTQQAFIKAMQALPRYESRGVPFKAWLYRIALNEVRMFHRSHKGRVNMDLGIAETRMLLEDAGQPEQEERMRLLEGALARLREESAAMIEMRYFDGMSFAEMGQVLGISEDAAKMRTHRVLGSLRDYLSKGR